MIYLVLFCVILTSIFLYLLIELKQSIHLIYIIPLSLFFILGTYFYINDLLGYPTVKTNEKDFYLLNYFIGPDEESIYLWVIIKGENKPKAITLPYTADDHKSLENMKESLKNGEPIEGEFYAEIGEQGMTSDGHPAQDEQANSGTDKSRSGSFNLLKIDLTRTMPTKDYDN